MSGETNSHSILFSGSSLDAGKTFWYIQKADTELERLRYVQEERDEENPLTSSKEKTEFGKEVGFDEIHWWVFKKEDNVDELLKRTEETLESAQKLMKSSEQLKKKTTPKSYNELIQTIKDFTESHKEEINRLFDYVLWLRNKNILAPCILFAHPAWSYTRLGIWHVDITANNPDEDSEGVKVCTEVVLGLRENQCDRAMWVRSEMEYEIFESMDHEEAHTAVVPEISWILRASYQILEELAHYFEYIRDSLRNIISEIKRYKIPERLLKDESFWKRFILKAMQDGRVEPESWDFKETLEIWHTSNVKKKVDFCEKVAAFANKRGGVLIIGVSDASPRHLVDIKDLENRIKATKSTICKYINHSKDFTHLQQIIIKDTSDIKKNCLIVVIAQTKDTVSVKDDEVRTTHPIRIGAGLERWEKQRIDSSKRLDRVLEDNYGFLLDLKEFIS